MTCEKHLKKSLNSGQYDKLLFKNSRPNRLLTWLFGENNNSQRLSNRINYDVEQGLRRRPAPRKWLTQVAIMGCVATPLFWWLSSSNASYQEQDSALPVAHTAIDEKHSTDVELAESLALLPLSLLHPPEMMLNQESFAEEHDYEDAQSEGDELFAEDDSESDDTSDELTAIDETPTDEWVDAEVNPGDTLGTIFARHNLDQDQIYQLLALSDAKLLERLRPDQALRIKRDEQGGLEDLVLVLDFNRELHIYRKNEEFVQEIRERPVQTQVLYAQGCVQSNLYSDAQKAGLTSAYIKDLKSIFADDVDLKNLQKGDKFVVIYSQHTYNNEVEEGDVLAAEFMHEGKTYQAVRYTDAKNRTSYYQPNEKSAQAINQLVEHFDNACETAKTAKAPFVIKTDNLTLAWELTPKGDTALLQQGKPENVLTWLQADLSKDKNPVPVSAPAPVPTQVASKPTILPTTSAKKPTLPSLLRPTQTANNRRTGDLLTRREREQEREANRRRTRSSAEPTLISRRQPEYDLTASRVSRRQTVAPLHRAPETPETENISLANEGIGNSNSVVANANELLGTRYRFGGTSPTTGFDCSGFVQYNAKKAGYSLPRTSREQYSSTNPVNKGELKPGDLVFFKARSNRVDHVGIYIGNNEFIHSPRSGKNVSISKLDDDYYSRRFIRGGRYDSK